jgi:hypothetical protein
MGRRSAREHVDSYSFGGGLYSDMARLVVEWLQGSDVARRVPSLPLEQLHVV